MSDSPSSSSRVWFITGTSTGFGRLLAEELLRRGNSVIATAREISKIEDLVHQYPDTARAFTLDVTNPAQIQSVAQQAITAFGHVDVLVNNAGYGVTGAIEEVTEDEFEHMFQTNIYGLIRTTRAFLPHFRQRRTGHIFNLSSIGGLIGGPGWGFYNTTKFAVEGFSEALAAEMKPLGVHVTVIEPGPFRTDFLGRSGKLAAQELPEYAETAGKSRDYFRSQAGEQPGDPQRAVEAIIAVADSPAPPLHLILGKIALTRFRDKLAQWQKEIAAWEPVTLGSDFPEGK
ncbi:MAG: oxidoreductase [Terracidiphilus sp.]|jgi:NAD(P)-dependent dehydrogenase (short-subunit alcohol dehydrogenase family)